MIAVCLLQSPDGPGARSGAGGRRRTAARADQAGAGLMAPLTAPTTDPARAPRRARPASRLTEPASTCPVLATLALLRACMFVVGGIALRRRSPTPQVVLNLFIDNAFLIVLAVGMTFVILTGGIDLSVGVGGRAVHDDRRQRCCRPGWPPLVVIVAGAADRRRCSAWLMGCVIHYFDIQPFIVTLAGMFLARGLCYVISTDVDPDHRPVLRRRWRRRRIPLGGDSTSRPAC